MTSWPRRRVVQIAIVALACRIRRLRLGMMRKIFWRAAYDELHRRQLSRNHVAVVEPPVADRDVDAVLHEIREAIVEMEIDRDAGIAARELRQQRHEILAPEPDRRTHPQDPGWCASRVA